MVRRGRYGRALIVRGSQAWAAIGCGADEDDSTADAALGYGLIWLEYLRQRYPRFVLAGLKVFLPAGRVSTTQTRMAWLNADVARWELYETREAPEEPQRLDITDIGNLKTTFSPLPKLAATASPAADWGKRIASWSAGSLMQR